MSDQLVPTTGPAAPPARPTSGLAFASLICSVFGMGLFGVICGHLALNKIKNHPRTRGKDAAVAGLILGYFGILVILVATYALASANDWVTWETVKDRPRIESDGQIFDSNLNHQFREAE